jgi:hypothetical protein
MSQLNPEMIGEDGTASNTREESPRSGSPLPLGLFRCGPHYPRAGRLLARRNTRTAITTTAPTIPIIMAQFVPEGAGIDAGVVEVGTAAVGFGAGAVVGPGVVVGWGAGFVVEAGVGVEVGAGAGSGSCSASMAKTVKWLVSPDIVPAAASTTEFPSLIQLAPSQ